MKHAKRMVLVPEDVLNRYEQKQKIETSPITSNMMHQDVIGHLPATLRPKAATLLRRLKARPDVISWDDSGQVKVDGKEIPDSNISDLVSDAMRARKNFNPKGAQEFFRGLLKINVPKDIARNTERWDQVQMGSPSGAEEAVFKTPPPRPPCKSREISPWFTQKTGGETKTMASLLKNVVTVCM